MPATFSCPDTADQRGSIYFTDPDNQCRFYQCDSGSSVLKSCGPGTKWSQADLGCVHMTGEVCSTTGMKPTTPAYHTANDDKRITFKALPKAFAPAVAKS